MKHGCTHIAMFILLLLAGARLAAQVSIKVTPSRDKILIGEPVSVSIEAYVPVGSQVGWFTADSIQHFDIASRSPIDTAEGLDGKRISQVLTLTSFDSGRWTIPPFEVNVGGKPYYSDSLTVDVSYISFDPKEDYRDIKDIIVVDNPALRYIPLIIAAMALLSLLIVIYLLRKQAGAPVPVVSRESARLSAYEEAVRSLAELRKKGVQEGSEKAWYSEMNDILRQYVSRSFGISTIERTNEELILQLAGMRLPQQSFNSLMQSLRMSDFVKFAKYRPSDKDNTENFDTVRSSIDLLNNYSRSAV